MSAVPPPLSHLSTSERVTAGASVALFALAGIVVAVGAGSVVRFVTAGLALAAIAALVGQAIEHVGEALGAGATGLLQSTLGNLPELFVALFALNKGLTGVVQAALVGSVLGNAVLVLGLAFVAGGIRHGTQKFDPEEPRLYSSLLLLVVAALLVPTLASKLGTPAARHAGTLSDVCAVALLIVYLVSIPFWLGSGRGKSTNGGGTQDPANRSWSLGLSVIVLAFGSLGSAFASEWFVEPLKAATSSLGLSQTFTGLVVVAIASNAVEHAVGIRFALKAKPAYAISTTLSSPLQVALFLTPILVLLSPAVGPARLTLVFPPLLVAALGISALVVVAVVYDGEYTWLEGVALVALYCIVAAAFWWG
ncbi:MAG TPA: calcium/proton exchanger [Acidimicrobiales bacterium]|nr:calcium/proton exchanger [Acidimicrobiales bacterium]